MLAPSLLTDSYIVTSQYNGASPEIYVLNGTATRRHNSDIGTQLRFIFDLNLTCPQERYHILC